MTPITLTALLLSCFLRGGVVPLVAQSPPTPEAAAEELLTALAEKRWLDAARMVDPAELERFKEQQLLSISRMGEIEPTSAEEYRKHQPEMPQAVAEWMARQGAESREQYRAHQFEQFAGVDSVADLERLSPTELMASWLEGNDPDHRVRRMFELSGRELPAEAARDEGPQIERSVVGALREGDALAAIVYRSRWDHGGEPSPAGELQVVAAGLMEDGWRLRIEGSDQNLFRPIAMYVVPVDHAQVREQVQTVLAWDRGRAFLTGYGEDPLEKPPEALVLERGDGERFEIPRSMFRELVELLGTWGWMETP